MENIQGIIVGILLVTALSFGLTVLTGRQHSSDLFKRQIHPVTGID